jgi:hypothetical protein
MASQAYDKCLMTHLNHGTDRVAYILPYSGNLTDSKYAALAKRLADVVAKLYEPAFTHEQVEQELTKRLKSEWMTGREKWVYIEPDERGTFTLKGENWFFYGWPQNHFKVVQ